MTLTILLRETDWYGAFVRLLRWTVGMDPLTFLILNCIGFPIKYCNFIDIRKAIMTGSELSEGNL